MFEDYYSGSMLLKPLSDKTGVGIDRLNFVVSQLIALGTAFFMRKFLHPSTTSQTARHSFSCIVGLLLSYFCFGNEVGHLLFVATVCYLIITFQSSKSMPNIVFVISMGYLATIHLKRLIYNYGAYNLDITGPLMVLVQRASGLAFSLHDGMACDYNKISPYRQKYVTKAKPTILEYYGYLFQFQSILAGPNVLFKDYIQFIDGTNFKNAKLNSSNGNIVSEPSPVKVVLQKFLISIACIILYLTLYPRFSIDIARGNKFLYEWNGFQQMAFLVVCTTLTRFMYYHAWILSDAVCNASGLGFSGYDEKGNAKWDITQNVDILGFEFSDNLRNAISCWNTGTNVWLRFLVYERLEKYNKTLFTFLLSAAWHGFYPGYYLCFITAALFVTAARNIRKYIRPYFVNNSTLKMIYDGSTLLTTRIFIAYFTFPFVIYDFWPVLIIFKNLFFICHLTSLFAIFALPMLIKKLPKPSTPSKQD